MIRIPWARGISRLAILLSLLVAIAISLDLLLAYGASGEKEVNWATQSSTRTSQADDGHAEDVLSVMSMNLAHGRDQAVNQLLVSRQAFPENLDSIAAVFDREEPDIIALQEADGSSWWSGNFDHVEYLIERTAYPYYVHGRHVDGLGLSYGTALLSEAPISSSFSYRFEPSPPGLAKGFVLASIQWPESGTGIVDILSIHLDFARQAVRNQQVDEIFERVKDRGNPIIVIGDFNAEWDSNRSPVRKLAEQIGLSGFEPEDDSIYTYPGFQTRLDWILISCELEFVDHQVLLDRVSDHLPLMAGIRFAENGECRGPLIDAMNDE